MDLEKYNGIEIPARNKMIWEEAILFYQLGQDAQKKMEEDKKYIVPAIVNVAFSCELFLKSMLKDGTRAVVKKDSYPVLPIFKLLAEKGNIDEHMMYNTYNMGLGMILAVDPADVDKTMEAIRKTGDNPYVVGTIEEGEKGVTLC